MTYLYRMVHVLTFLLTFLVVGCRTVTVQDLNHKLTTLGIPKTHDVIIVSTPDQTLTLLSHGKKPTTYTISTSKKGIGQRANTFKTPIGLHRINEKIGERVPPYGIFVKRQYVGEAWKPLPRAYHRKDYISTRILRLEGLEPGLNKGIDKRGHLVDTNERAVYIHGTTMEWLLGSPSTKGCVHMSAQDIANLFSRISVGTLVWITPHQFKVH